MENVMQYQKVKSSIKVVLLVLTILMMGFVTWAGFTGRESIFPLILSLTLFLSICNLQLANENPERRKMYKVLFIVSCLSVVLALVKLIVGW